MTVDFINISRGCGGEVGWRSTGAFGCQGLGVFGLAVEREPFRVLELPLRTVGGEAVALALLTRNTFQ